MKLNFRPLFAEKDDDNKYTIVSLGRVAFWICFMSAMYFWLWRDVDIHPSHLQMLYITATYNLMKKATWFGNITTPTAKMEISHDAEVEKSPKVKG